MSSVDERKPEDRTEHFEIIKDNGGEVVILNTFSTVHSAVHSTEIIKRI